MFVLLYNLSNTKVALSPLGDVPAPAALLPSERSFVTYGRVPWKLRVRKELFSPLETYNDPAILDLIYAQVSILSVFALNLTILLVECQPTLWA